MAFADSVLILVLVEDGFGVLRSGRRHLQNPLGLNPCFSGRWFRRRSYYFSYRRHKNVLILVLVEDGFGADAQLQC